MVTDEVFLKWASNFSGNSEIKKSHTCEEGGAHLRISVWDLLMNLKNNYLSKSGPTKNVRILIFTMLHFLKNIKKNIRYFTPVYQKFWWYDPKFLRYWVWLAEIGNYLSFLPFYLPALKTQKITILKKKKKIAGDNIILHMHQKPQSHEVWFLIFCETNRIFCHFGSFFALLPP